MLPSQAAKTIVPFSYTETLPVPKATNVNVTWTPNWQTNINRGTYRTSTYNGPLGTGTIYYEAIISVTHYDNQTTGYTTFSGHGNYKEVITITNGPYGTGTIEGMRVMQWDFDISRPVSTRYHLWGNATYQHGTNGLEGVRMEVTSIDIYQINPNRISTYKGNLILQ
jgi:hypothetical protein